MSDINIACIVIAYALADDLLALFQAADAPNITWHVFLHSSVQEVMNVCWLIVNHCQSQQANYHPYQVNRGLSMSWNEGIVEAYQGSFFNNLPPEIVSVPRQPRADVAIIINDDMLPGPGDVQKVAQAAMEHSECGIIKCMGMDMRSQSKRTTMEFGLTAITKRGWETVGCFDENISPIYWEDIDWDRRRQLAGLPMYTVQDTNAVHQGSKTSLVMPDGVALAQQAYDRNQAYYMKKWGGLIGMERFTHPFDNPAFGLKIEPGIRHDPYLGI